MRFRLATRSLGDLELL